MFIYIYHDLCLNVENKENVNHTISYNLQSLQDDFRNHHTVLNASGTFWNIQFACEKYLEVSMYDKKLFNGKQVFRTIKVFNDLTWETIYAGCKSSCSALITNLPSKIGSLSQLIEIIKVVEVWKICKGANNPSFSVLKNTVYDIQGEEIGVMKEVAELDQYIE